MANDNRLIINDSFEYGYKIVSNNVEGRRVHSIVDRFGNILDFFFDDEPKLIPISYEKCFALGNDKHGKNQFCKLFSSYRDPEKNGCEKITSFQEVSGIHKINNDRLLLLTSNGLCFFDTNDLEQASDFFDSQVMQSIQHLYLELSVWMEVFIQLVMIHSLKKKYQLIHINADLNHMILLLLMM